MSAAPAKSTHTLRNVSLLLLALAAGGWWWSSHRSAAPDAAAPKRGGGPVAVAVAPVMQQDAPLQLEALGTVTATNTVTVHSRVDGQLMALHFEEGQLVQKGQLLAELDPRPFQAALTQAEGQLMRDQALLQNARLDLTRYQQLLAQNSIAKQQVDTQQALVAQYQGTVKLDQGAVATARLQLDYSRITAPLSGRVGLRQVDLGNIVHSSDSNGVVVITQTQPINVLFAVPETSLGQVLAAARAAKGKLQVEAWDRDNRHKLADGELLAIDNQLSTTTGTVNLKARFANADAVLFPNQFVNVHLQLGDQPDAIVVPSVALQQGKVGSYVYTVNPDQTVSISKVKTGAVSGDNTIIEEGVKPGQKVVVDGLDKLREGAQIKVIDRAMQNAADGNGKGKGRGKQHAASGSWGGQRQHASAAN
ncbi:MdtA/MuxA family multidrug efflux RND transporter periplasmic adaptor subunit [Aquitalea sp. USM4]|uniref:MdtA/MuxA family multidrug efflux RND transporter periplasmic adaptor subunit n=1 Tax=Aquitalea TaxID=407217 RepID=UPI00103930CA|nr:MdtA/MuxA family multidrug efflux RND transporter periplasmic adaptor subunit [Aquitalea sp. USM4]QBJ78313.1 multidrug transporter subunit MdtA [Aquitalea sp. USM4]